MQFEKMQESSGVFFLQFSGDVSSPCCLLVIPSELASAFISLGIGINKGCRVKIQPSPPLDKGTVDYKKSLRQADIHVMRGPGKPAGDTQLVLPAAIILLSASSSPHLPPSSAFFCVLPLLSG